MSLRRFFWVTMIFGIGVSVGMLMLHATARPLNAPEAQRRALLLLNQPPAESNIGDNKVVAAVHRIAPAVVNIDTVGVVHTADGSGAAWLVDQEVRGKGSGVILTPDGYIVTNNHVIDGANRIRVTLPNGHWYYAHLIGRDAQTDLAVVRIDASGLPIAELGDSERLQVGESCVAVGNPLGLGSTVTSGIISALNRHNLQIDDNHIMDGAIQTDAAINRGNSGGALANINGQLIGINTAILSAGPNGGSIGLGFALPINMVRRVARDLIANGKAHIEEVKMPWLGIQFAPVPEEMQHLLHLAPERGALVRRALPGGPAERAGLHSLDILLSIDGKEIGDLRDVREAITQRKVGDKTILHLLRPADHHEYDVTATLAEIPQNLPH